MLTAKLIDSVAAENLTVAAECLEEGGNPNTLSGDGATAMHIAAGVGVDAVRLMLAHGGDPNVRSVDGSTPLHVAAAWGDRDTLRLLLHNGADPNVMDHEGQRAVDVARSEHHAACVDFLKYYTMLVAVGDEEESPLYTSELISCGQDVTQGLNSSYYPPRGSDLPPDPYPAHYSDEDDPVCLSNQYSDALSRRLSRLLNDGNSACLDVTSPDCPYIGNKCDRYHGGGNRTLLADDVCAGYPDLPDLSSSNSSENDVGLSEPLSSGRHSSHCCLHNHPKQPASAVCPEAAVCCEMGYSGSPSSLEYCDPQTSYARNVEMKMKHKYFPDLGEDRCMSDRHCGLSRLNRSGENTSKHCSHSYFKSLSPQPVEYVDEDRAGYDSSHAQSSILCKSRMSRSGKKAVGEETGYCLKVKPCKLSSCSCCHCVKQHSSSPDKEHSLGHREPYSSPRRKHQCSLSTDSRHQSHAALRRPCSPRSDGHYHTQKPLHSSVRRGLQFEPHTSPHRSETTHHCTVSRQSPHSSNIDLSHYSPLKDPSVSPVRPILRHSRSDHGKEGCCDQGQHCSAVNRSLRKQTTYPPADQSHCSASRPRSPVTIMHVQAERPSPPHGVFHRAVHFPFSPPWPKQECSEFTAMPGSSKKLNTVAGSGSSHSVDSGFCEKGTTRQGPGDEAAVLLHGPKSSRPGRQKHASPVLLGEKRLGGASAGHMSHTESKEKDREKELFLCGSYNGFSHGDDSHLGATNKFNNRPAFPVDYTIVSSNLRGRKRSDLIRQSKHVHAVCDEGSHGNGKTQTSIQEIRVDVSESSCDSFETCEEASVKETPVDEKSGHRSRSQESLLGTKHAPYIEKHGNVAEHPETATDFEKQRRASSCSRKDTEANFKMESLGFSVVEAEGSKHNHNRFANKKDITAVSHVSPNLQEKERAKSRTVAHAAEHRHVMASKDNSLYRQTSSRSWRPPSGPAPDDSDLMTSDGSFMERVQTNHHQPVVQPNNVSKWLLNMPPVTPKSTPDDGKQRGSNRKRMSNESFISVASSVQEYIYRDKENGIVLIERHIPSEFSGSSGRPSLESSVSPDTEATVSYEWSDFVINSDDASSTLSSTSFDITAGQTMKSQDTIKTVDTNSCDEACGDASDDCEQEGDDIDRQEDKGSEKTAKKHSKQKPQQISDTKKDKNKKSVDDSQQTEVPGHMDSGVSPDDVTVPPKLASLSNAAIYQSLKDLGEDCGPVLPSTRQTYLQLLASLQSGKRHLGLTSSQPGYSSELNRLLSGSLDMEDLAKAELSMVAQFQAPDGRTWREGTIKSCFNYLLLDPRTTDNLPLRAKALSDTEAFKIFLSAIFYIGKGKRSRPYCHLYEAISQQKSPKLKVSQKVQQILDVWSAGLGVVSLHCFQNVIPVEAYTREACMVDAIGLGRLTNVKKGDYYGVASTWPMSKRRCMGAYLLRKAFQIFLSEGERQICPLDIRKGQ